MGPKKYPLATELKDLVTSWPLKSNLDIEDDECKTCNPSLDSVMLS